MNISKKKNKFYSLVFLPG